LLAQIVRHCSSFSPQTEGELGGLLEALQLGDELLPSTTVLRYWCRTWTATVSISQRMCSMVLPTEVLRGAICLFELHRLCGLLDLRTPVGGAYPKIIEVHANVVAR
jgi:hypothetical protein